MIEQQTSWGLLEPPMYLRDSGGVQWRVLAKRRIVGGGWELRLLNAEGGTVDVEREFDAPVTLLVPSIDDAEATVLTMLRVTGVVRKVVRMEEISTYPDSKWVRAAIAAHLRDMHRISITTTAHVENNDIAGLIETHNLEHASPTPGWVPHIHVPSGDL